jgi:glycerophosphoryl diester phosphodiesterase
MTLTKEIIEAAEKDFQFVADVVEGTSDTVLNPRTGQVQKTLPKIIDDLDWSYVGLFADGVTFTDKTDFAVDAVGTQWIYTGSLPFSAAAGTVPSEPTYQVVHVRSADAISNANGGSVQDFIDAQYTTVAELATGKFHVGQYVRLTDRAMGLFLVQSGGTPDGKGVLDAGNSNTAVLKYTQFMNIRAFGAKLDGSIDDSIAMQRMSDLNITGIVDTDYYAETDVIGGSFISSKPVKNLSSGAVYVKNTSEKSVLNKIELIAHRGLAGANVQNSMAAFVNAAALGFKSMELDVNYSADGTFYVFHDAVVDNITTGTGTLRELTDEYLDGLTFSFVSGKYSDMRILKLDEFLKIASRRGWKLYIELKEVWDDTKIFEMIDLLEQYGFNNDACHLQASTVLYLETIRGYSENIGVALITGVSTLPAIKDLLVRLSQLHHAVTISDKSVMTRPFVEFCQGIGVGVIAYTTVKEYEAITLLSNGVSRIMTDCPLVVGGYR